MRGWLNDRRSYVPPVAIGEVMRGNAIARVLAVKGGSGKFHVGDIVNASTGFRELAVLDEAKVDAPPQLPAGAQAPMYDDAPPSYDEAMAQGAGSVRVRPAWSGVSDVNAPSSIPEKR